MNFPLRTAFAVSHMFWSVVHLFSFVSRNFFYFFLISLFTHSLFNSMLFNLHEFECFWVFSLRLVSSFSPLWSEKMLDMIWIFLNLLRLALCPIMYSIFEVVPGANEKNVYFASLGWKALSIYQLSPFHLGHCSMRQCLCWYFVWKICLYLTVGCWNLV